MLHRALQICTIASVAVAVHADLLLAVNVKDFRYMANKFLSKDLAEKLTDLVSKVSLTRTPDVRSRANKEEFGKENKPINDGRRRQRPNKKVNLNKRFVTIRNSNKDVFDCENNSSGPVYVRDEIDEILKNINHEYTFNEKTSLFDYNTTPPYIDDNINSKEIKSNKSPNAPRESKDQSDTHKKIDYTETKLGEWKYNHVELTKPIEIKNVKKGNLDRYTNDQDFDETRKNQFPNVKNVQYVYETRLDPQVKNKYINTDISNYHKRGLIYLGLTNKHTKKGKVYDTQVDEEESFNSYISGTKPKNSLKPHKIEPTELNEMYNKQLLRYLNEFSTTKDDRQIFREPILGNKYKMDRETIPPNQDEIRMSQDVREINPESKKIKINKLLNDSVEVKEVREQETSSKHNLGSNIKIQQINPAIRLVGVNDMDSKYELGTEYMNNYNDRGFQHKSVEEGEDKIRDRKIHNADYENKDKGDESNNEHLLLRHKKRYLDFKGSQNSDKNRERDQSNRFAAHDRFHKSETVKSKFQDSLKHSKVSEDQSVQGNVEFKKENFIGKKKLRKEPIEENDIYEKFALGSNDEWSRKAKNRQKTKVSQLDSKVEFGPKVHKLKFSFHSNEDKDRQESDGKYDLAYKNTRNRKPQKPIEENKMYNQIALGSENTKNKKRITNQSFKDHGRYDQGSNEELPIKKKPQKLNEENDIKEKDELGHEINEGNRNAPKQKEGSDKKRTNLSNKNKLNYGYKDDKNGHTEILTQNDKRDKYNEITKKNEEYKEDAPYVTEKAPSEGYADDPRPDFAEIKPESIKANTESLIDDDEKVNKGVINKFTMKGTNIPKRDYYKLSSPNYYKDLPRDVDKYDFEEPLPERDREREKEDKVKREPATINRKFKLTFS